MNTYAQFRPTGFDRAGLGIPDRQSWLVLLTRTRDSGHLDESNFAIALRDLGGESDTVEVHRFGHWACGWLECILVDPDSDQATIAAEIEGALSDYPVLSDEDYSERQWTAACEWWTRMSVRDRVEVCQRFNVCIFAARRDDIPEDDTGALLDYLSSDC